jgi:hypothetical protein
MAHVLSLAVQLTESASSEGGEGPNAYVIGAITLGILLAALLAVVSIGGGRDHT